MPSHARSASAGAARRSHSYRESRPPLMYIPLVNEQHCVRREGTQGDKSDLYLIGLNALRGTSSVGFRVEGAHGVPRAVGEREDGLAGHVRLYSMHHDSTS